jgi:hypothetical protein
MYPHRIRLRGPWECEPLARRVSLPDGTRLYTAVDLPAPGRIKMPSRWCEAGLSGFAGKARLRRRFGLPRRLDANERVWLTFAGADSATSVCLNGRFLGECMPASCPFEFHVTELLRDSNELVVEIESADDSGGLWGEVALEIRCLAFLRDVRAGIDSSCRRIIVEGRVIFSEKDADPAAAGSSDFAPLEIYVLHDRRTIGYRALTGRDAEQPFQLMSDELAEPPKDDVLVQLVCGATVWYEVTCKIQSERAGAGKGR